MKRLAINLTICLASFALGVAAASFLNWIKRTAIPDQPRVSGRSVWDQAPPAFVPEPDESPVREVVFDGDRLRIVSEEVKLKSERLRYKADVTYPQIVGSDARHIQKLNQRIKQLVTEYYEWPLSPSKADVRYYQTHWSKVFNTVDLSYQVTSMTDSFLSIHFNAYNYGIGAAHSAQDSFVLNYDLTLRKELKLSDLFKPRSKYLEFIAEYCATRLSARSSVTVELNPSPASFESWNITDDGILFNFDACTVMACADGSQSVEIPFADLKEFLR